MSKDEIFQKVRTILTDNLACEAEVKPESIITTELGLDSIDVIELVMECEKQFGIAIPDDTMDRIYKVDDIVNVIMTSKINGWSR